MTPNALDLAIFKACPSNFMLLLPDVPKFTIVQVTDYHCTLLSRKREDLVSRGLFECYPPNPENHWDESSSSLLLKSLSDVVETESPHTLIAQYDVLNPVCNTFEVRYWSIANIPIIIKDKLTYILNTSIDVTAFYNKGFKVQ